jgi:hypothetical protein
MLFVNMFTLCNNSLCASMYEGFCWGTGELGSEATFACPTSKNLAWRQPLLNRLLYNQVSHNADTPF